MAGSPRGQAGQRNTRRSTNVPVRRLLRQGGTAEGAKIVLLPGLEDSEARLHPSVRLRTGARIPMHSGARSTMGLTRPAVEYSRSMQRGLGLCLASFLVSLLCSGSLS